MEDRLARLMQERMAAEGLSLRALARQAGIDHSTLSRLLRGKSRPSMTLLAAVAPHLHLETTELLQAAGVLPEEPARIPWEALHEFGLDPTIDTTLVTDQLLQLRLYAESAEARAIVRERLEPKIKELGARGPTIEHLRQLAHTYLNEQEPSEVRMLAGSGVLYFLLAMDYIDDHLFPIGYLDDAVAIALVEQELTKLRAPE